MACLIISRFLLYIIPKVIFYCLSFYLGLYMRNMQIIGENRQHGFTLIELIIVIVILGILSVTAAPRFINVSEDAQSASLNAMQGALKSANAFVYGKALISGQEKALSSSITSGNATINTTVGYISPLASNVMLALDGSYEEMANANDTITADWGIFNLPGGVSVYIVPKGYAAFDSCNLLYNVDATNITDPAFYSVTTSGC